MAAALFHECFTTLFSAIVPNRLRNVGAKGAQPRTWSWLDSELGFGCSCSLP